MKLNMIKKISLPAVILFSLVFSGCKQQGDDIYIINDKRKSSDVLVLMYLSGDANNGDNFLPSIQQAEDALTYIRNEDNSAKSGYKSVNVVALFDGATGSDDYVKSDSTTRLLELGRGFHDLTGDGTNSGLYEYNKSDWSFSSNTIDLSSSADWIKNNGKQELNMGSYKTLTSFLTWVNKYYTGKEVILAFGDHGGGPAVEVENTSTLWTSRAIIFDDDKNGDKNYCLRTCDVVNALNEAGYTGKSAPDLIIEDLCLGGSIEEAYGLQGAAHYFMGSPNITWGNSMGYYHFVINLANSKKDLETVCKEEIDNFAQKWPLFDEKSGSSTFTFADLSANEAMENVKKNVSLFAEKVITDKTKYGDLIKSIKDMTSASKDIKYEGSFVDLKDTGWLFESAGKNYPELNSYCSVIKENLSKIIISAFGSMYYYTNHENGSFSITNNNKTYNGVYADGSWYGLSISVSQQSYVKDADSNVINYENCTLFGKDNKWGELLRAE